MNPQFPNNRATLPTNNNLFYNPQKDNNINSQPFYNQGPQFTPFVPNNTNPKSYIARSNIIEGKINNSATNLLKNNGEIQMPMNKLTNNSMTSPSHHSNNFPSFQPFNKSTS